MNNNHRGLPSSHPAISRWSSQTRDASGGSQVNSCHFCQNERELPHLRCHQHAGCADRHQHAGCADRRLLEVRDRLLSAGTHAQITTGKYCSTLSQRLVPDFYHLDKYCSTSPPSRRPLLGSISFCKTPIYTSSKLSVITFTKYCLPPHTTGSLPPTPASKMPYI